MPAAQKALDASASAAVASAVRRVVERHAVVNGTGHGLSPVVMVGIIEVVRRALRKRPPEERSVRGGAFGYEQRAF